MLKGFSFLVLVMVVVVVVVLLVVVIVVRRRGGACGGFNCERGVVTGTAGTILDLRWWGRFVNAGGNTTRSCVKKSLKSIEAATMSGDLVIVVIVVVAVAAVVVFGVVIAINAACFGLFGGWNNPRKSMLFSVVYKGLAVVKLIRKKEFGVIVSTRYLLLFGFAVVTLFGLV